MSTDAQSSIVQSQNTGSTPNAKQDGPDASDTLDQIRQAWSTSEAPKPVGSYSQAISAGGMLFISGQTPRRSDGTPCHEAPFEVQARIALTNLGSIANQAGLRLSEAAMVTVYLTDPKLQAPEFDRIYREFLDASIPYPARAIVQSDLPNGAIEITAVIPQ